MSSAPAREPVSPLTRDYFPLAALLSYLVPGLGQISQGRIGKGVLFFVCVLSLFYYGMFLGSWSNVYIPQDKSTPWGEMQSPLGNLWNRPQFVAQFWVGIAAWPAIAQHLSYDQTAEEGPIFGSYQRLPYEERTRTAPAPDSADNPEARKQAREGGLLSPNHALRDWKGKTLNELQNEGDKTWDLGWVFTVIAGALNVMVIYDAFAGPAYVISDEVEGEG
jgi:hypothetical protein